MTIVTFDTLKFVHRLKNAGVPEVQAEAFKDAQGEGDLATNHDIALSEHRIIGKMYQAMLIQTFALAAFIGALKIFG